VAGKIVAYPRSESWNLTRERFFFRPLVSTDNFHLSISRVNFN